jgi:hypothetical protein
MKSIYSRRTQMVSNTDDELQLAGPFRPDNGGFRGRMAKQYRVSWNKEDHAYA